MYVFMYAHCIVESSEKGRSLYANYCTYSYMKVYTKHNMYDTFFYRNRVYYCIWTYMLHLHFYSAFRIHIIQIQIVCFLEIEPMTFALQKQCSVSYYRKMLIWCFSLSVTTLDMTCLKEKDIFLSSGIKNQQIFHMQVSAE